MSKELNSQIQNEDLKQRITIDAMLIIGKYFGSSNDYVNIMKTSKRYHDLTAMYHYNPISDAELFENAETQYLYGPTDVKKEGMKHYIFVQHK